MAKVNRERRLTEVPASFECGNVHPYASALIPSRRPAPVFTPDMAGDLPDPAKSKSAKQPRRQDDGFPSNQELLHELRFHGAKKSAPREIPAVSRRTRDYLLVAGTGSV